MKLSVTAEMIVSELKKLAAGPHPLFWFPGVPRSRHYQAIDKLIAIGFLTKDGYKIELTDEGRAYERPIKLGEMTAADIVVGGLYRAKRPKPCGFLSTQIDDRVIIYMDKLDTGEHRGLQYDSYSVRDGLHYPRVSVGKFLRWASHRINEDGTRWVEPEIADAA